MPEIVGAGFHGEPIHPDHHLVLAGAVPVGLAAVAVVAGAVQDAVGNEILARAVALHDGLDEVLRHIIEVREQLLRVFREAVATIAEGGVVIVRTDARVEAHAVDDGPSVESLHLSVGVELVEVADAQGEIGVREELHRFRLRAAHEQHGDIVLQGALFNQSRECMCRFFKRSVIETDDDARRIEVIIERLGFAQELRSEDNPRARIAIAEAAGIADRHGTLDNHRRGRIHRQHQFDHLLDVGSVEIVLLRVIVRRRGNHHEISVLVCRPPVQRRRQAEWLLRQILLDILILDG